MTKIEAERRAKEAAALKLREEVLTLRRKVLGPMHPDTLKAMSNLALSYADVGRLGEALDDYLRTAGLKKRLQQAAILEEWAELVGPQIAAVTAPQFITADGVMRVMADVFIG